ncbi:hypothetical protein AVEN_241214-1 [Araneus ventricosus]|uniref:Uncharacterized protein n=1 Tax=Araneus ventricosus TaxID=182803 RepID=A0A4Y2D0J1_ARAVE|nr:hypothetical protein AVEN_241214-1 [Araneus ventricosus]
MWSDDFCVSDKEVASTDESNREVAKEFETSHAAEVDIPCHRNEARTCEVGISEAQKLGWKCLTGSLTKAGEDYIKFKPIVAMDQGNRDVGAEEMKISFI